MILLEVVLDWAFQVAPVVKNQPANAGDIRDRGLSLDRDVTHYPRLWGASALITGYQVRYSSPHTYTELLAGP